MVVIQYLKKLLEGRGFFASFLVISGWSYGAILFLVIIYELLLYTFGVKLENKKFEESKMNNPKEKTNNKSK